MCEPDWIQTQPTFDAALWLSICWNTVHEYNLVTHMKELNSSRSWGNIRSRSPGHQNWKMFLMDSFRFSLPFAHASTFHALDVKIQIWGRCLRRYFSRILPLFRDLIILFTSFLVVGRDKEKKARVATSVYWICLKEGRSSSRDLALKRNIGHISHKYYALCSSASLFRCSLVDTLAPLWSMTWT